MTDYIQLDYYDFKINIKSKTARNRELINATQAILQKYARKENMIKKGLMSESASEKLEHDKVKDIAQAYADYVIVGWEGEYRGEVLPEFNKENVVKLLSNPENDSLLADIIDQSANADFVNFECEEVEIKN